MPDKSFIDAPNTAVFTTKFVVEEKKPIIYVSHEIEDGAWQFFSEDDFEGFEDVAMIVSIQEIIDIDSSVLELANLPLGFVAVRESKNDEWKVGKQD